MDGDDIGLLKQLVLRDEDGSDFGSALTGEILAPGDRLHAEGQADLRHCAADIAETQKPERPPGHVIADRRCQPPRRSDAFSATRLRALARISAHVSSIVGAEAIAGMNDLHALIFRSLEIDRGVPQRGRGDQAQLGQALDDGARHRRALAHDADDVERLQALDDGLGVRRDGR